MLIEGDKVWKSSQWTPALRSSMLLDGFDSGQFDLRLAVRSDVTQGPTSIGRVQLVSVNTDRSRQRGIMSALQYKPSKEFDVTFNEKLTLRT